MQLVLNYNKKLDKTLLFTLEKLPTKLCNSLISYLNKNHISTVNEFRIKSGSFIRLIINNATVKTDVFVSQDLMEEIILKLCDGSIYSHISSIKEGYISVGKGIRAGICGKAVLENGQIEGIHDITSINIRIPRRVSFAGDFLFDFLKKHSFNTSVLLYSSPGVGKTTILRELITKLSLYTSIRHAVIDTREEIVPFLEGLISSDVFIGYPKGLAIELATKSMTPQIIICDEISSMAEAESINLAVNSGVNLIATTHANSFEELKKKNILSSLLQNGVFEYTIGISRNAQNRFIFDLNKWE